MAIEGPLRELGIHDVFQLLDLGRKTGRLRVNSALRDNEGTVFFREGRVTSASIRSNPHPLGALLVRAGKVTEADLVRARELQQAPGESRRLGEIMVSLGMLSHRDLARHVRQQVEVVVFELLSWQEGFFSFTEEPPAGDGGAAAASVTIEALLMEGARRLDEWARVRQRLPHLGVIPSLAEPDDAHTPALELLPNEWEVLSMIDGACDFRRIASTLGRSEFEVARIGFGLLTTGIIAIREPRPAEPLGDPMADGGAGPSADRRALVALRLDEAPSLAAAAGGASPVALAREAGDAAEPGALMAAARAAVRHGDLHAGAALWQQLVASWPDSPMAGPARDAMAHARRLTELLEAVDA